MRRQFPNWSRDLSSPSPQLPRLQRWTSWSPNSYGNAADREKAELGDSHFHSCSDPDCGGGSKDRHIQIRGRGEARNKPTFGHWIVVPRQFSKGRTVFSTNGAGPTGHLHRVKAGPFLTPHININSSPGSCGSGLSTRLWTRGSPVWFPVRAHAWVMG